MHGVLSMFLRLRGPRKDFPHGFGSSLSVMSGDNKDAPSTALPLIVKCGCFGSGHCLRDTGQATRCLRGRLVSGSSCFSSALSTGYRSGRTSLCTTATACCLTLMDRNGRHRRCAKLAGGTTCFTLS